MIRGSGSGSRSSDGSFRFSRSYVACGSGDAEDFAFQNVMS
jgi:hypothetical protein